MKRIICLFFILVLLLATLIGCSEYIAFDDAAETGESITPEQMVEISKEMQTTEAAPIEVASTESYDVESAPKDISVSFEQSIETVAPSTATTDAGNSVPAVTVEIYQTSPSGETVQKFVYWTPGGSVWHTTNKCSSLSRSKEFVKGSEAEALAAGKDRACKRCG